MVDFIKSMGAGATGAIVVYLLNFLIQNLLAKRIDKSIEHEYKIKYSKYESKVKFVDTVTNYFKEINTKQNEYHRNPSDNSYNILRESLNNFNNFIKYSYITDDSLYNKIMDYYFEAGKTAILLNLFNDPKPKIFQSGEDFEKLYNDQLVKVNQLTELLIKEFQSFIKN